LAVRSTGNDFSLIGQAVIAMLVQIGGVGIMTVATFVSFNLGNAMSLRHRAIISETLGATPEHDLRWVLRHVLQATAIAEGLGTAILTLWFHFAYQYPIDKAFGYGVFHSVSAFCNAGFGIDDKNLEPYQGDWVVNLTITTLIITGGIGFPVIQDIVRKWRGSVADCWDHLFLHSKLMLVGTAALLAIGTISFWLLEARGVLANMPWHKQLLVSYFQSVTPRTAGFNTVPYNQLSNATIFMTIMLMMVGAGPCSTGGGFKVSTLMVLVIRAWCTLRGLGRVQIYRRTIQHQAVEKAVAGALLFSAVGIAGLTLILVVEQSPWMRVARTTTRDNQDGSIGPSDDALRQFQEMERQREASLFLDASFEVISALGTVGLSTGLTTQLTGFGRIVIIVLMFIGRLGPLTVFIALAQAERAQRIEYAAEEPLIG
jgi:trk system potassium uptake protein TrkH